MRAFALMLLATSACDLPFEFNLTDGPGTVVCSGPTADVSGTWRLEGSGNRVGCEDESFDTSELQIRAERLALVQTGTDLAFDQEGFSLTGQVDGSCVYLDTDETVDGRRTRFRFEGQLEGSSRIEGTFTGDGPGTCIAEGRFVARRAVN